MIGYKDIRIMKMLILLLSLMVFRYNILARKVPKKAMRRNMDKIFISIFAKPSLISLGLKNRT